MSEMSTDTLKWLGGPSQFTFNNPKVEWVEDDQWGRRPTHGGLAAAATTSLTVTAQAHRFPVGTLFIHTSSGEIVRVTAVVDADTLTLQRDVPGAVTEGAWASADEVIVAGFAMSEDDNWVFRASAIVSLPFNYAQVHSLGVQVTFRRQNQALYGLRGTDLDYQSAAMVNQQMVAFEQELVHGVRFAGASVNRPAMLGGLDFYITSANGASVQDLAGAPLTRQDFDDALQDLYFSVGPENIARTWIGSPWAMRKVDSFFSGAERINSGATIAGTAIKSFHTVFGVINLVMSTAVAKNEGYLINRERVKMGSFEGLGRAHLLQLPSPSATGPRFQRAFYADVSVMVKGVQGMAKIEDFSITG